MHSRKQRKSSATRKRKSRTVRKYGRRKMKGGVSFNSPLAFSELPKADYIPLNTYTGGDVQREIIDSRLLPNIVSGGKKRTSRRNRTKRSRRRRNRKMAGGSLMGTDLLTGLSTSTSNAALAIGTTGGTNLMYDKLTGTAGDNGPELQPAPVMVAIV
jgi:hypothetical protein